ncbi:hypothetical protein F5X98DRAFT_54848 [Xylaria grammica]|nr:hypothetical protein F5X98DRAFT_54848 [Xylaria grammica]
MAESNPKQKIPRRPSGGNGYEFSKRWPRKRGNYEIEKQCSQCRWWFDSFNPKANTCSVCLQQEPEPLAAQETDASNTQAETAPSPPSSFSPVVGNPQLNIVTQYNYASTTGNTYYQTPGHDSNLPYSGWTSPNPGGPPNPGEPPYFREGYAPQPQTSAQPYGLSNNLGGIINNSLVGSLHNPMAGSTHPHACCIHNRNNSNNPEYEDFLKMPVNPPYNPGTTPHYPGMYTPNETWAQGHNMASNRCFNTNEEPGPWGAPIPNQTQDTGQYVPHNTGNEGAGVPSMGLGEEVGPDDAWATQSQLRRLLPRGPLPKTKPSTSGAHPQKNPTAGNMQSRPSIKGPAQEPGGSDGNDFSAADKQKPSRSNKPRRKRK